MATRINLSVGRQRITGRTLPHEAGYVTGIRQQMAAIRKKIKALVKQIDRVTPAALEFGLKPVFDKSQLFVPVDTGRLKRSGFLKSWRTHTGASVSIGYAKGGNPHYGSLVHERLDRAHKAPTRAKFLEEAINQDLHLFQPRVVKFMQDAAGLR